MFFLISNNGINVLRCVQLCPNTFVLISIAEVCTHRVRFVPLT